MFHLVPCLCGGRSESIKDLLLVDGIFKTEHNKNTLRKTVPISDKEKWFLLSTSEMEERENNLLAAREPWLAKWKQVMGFGPKYIGMCNDELGFKPIYHVTRHCHQLGTLPKGVLQATTN